MTKGVIMCGGLRRVRLVSLFALAVGLLLALPALAGAAKVINGGFETGNFAGWTVQDEAGSGGSWFVYSGTSSPLTGHPIPAPPEGTHAVISDQKAPSSNILYQDVTLGRKQRHILSLYVYYTSYAPLASPPSLDYTYGSPNQQYRIDLMKPTAPLMSVASTDILKTVFATSPSSPASMSPTLMSLNISSLAGDTVRLRIAQVDNSFYLNAGVDDVMITSTPLVKTKKASGVKAYRATLHGTVDANGGPTTYFFQYGKTKRYGKKTKIESAGEGTSALKELASLKGLKPSTTYHFRIVAKNAAATSKGRDRTFTTKA
jgi:hypothetical protein